MADAVFRVAADVSEYVGKMAYADKANKKVAQSAAKIGDSVAGATLKIDLLKRALDAAGRAVGAVLDKAGSSAKNAGDRAIDVATSLSSLGVKDIGAASKRLAAGTGGATAEQNAAFAKGLAGVNKSRRSPIGGDLSEEYLALYSDGGDLLFGAGGEDILEGASKGRSPADIRKRAAAQRPGAFGLLSDRSNAFNKGIEGRTAEESARRAEEASFLSSGTRLRVEAAGARGVAARDPGGPVSIVGGVLGDTAGGLVNRALGGSDAAQTRTAIATESMLQLQRKILTSPSFNTDTK